MIVLVALSAFATPAMPPQPAVQSLQAAPAACRTDLDKVKAGQSLRFSRLGDLPDAHQEIAVNRMLDGCPAPVVVRQDVSGKR